MYNILVLKYQSCEPGFKINKYPDPALFCSTKLFISISTKIPEKISSYIHPLLPCLDNFSFHQNNTS